jgi:hypothetical protein
MDFLPWTYECSIPFLGERHHPEKFAAAPLVGALMWSHMYIMFGLRLATGRRIWQADFVVSGRWRRAGIVLDGEEDMDLHMLGGLHGHLDSCEVEVVT